MNEPCLYCTKLPTCKRATPRMVELLEGCALFKEVPEPVVLARVDVATLLGPESITKKVGRLEMSDTERKAVAARKNLRSFAVKIGAVSAGASYRMKANDLVSAIEAVTDDNGNAIFPNVIEMTDEQIQKILSGLDSNAPAEPAPEPEPEPAPEPEEASKPARKPRKTRKSRKPKAEAPEPEPEPEEEAPAAPSRRRPTRRSRPQQSGSDLGLVTEMVKSIGVMTEATQDSLKTTNTDLAETQEKVKAIESFLVWFYNTEFADGEEIKSLSDVRWV